jgi:ribonuclease HII
MIAKVADSKQLTAAQRERLDVEIRAGRSGSVSDRRAGRDRPHEHLPGGDEGEAGGPGRVAPLVPGFVLVDGRRSWPRRAAGAYPKGDAFVLSIAAASIVAKVFRDAIMRR